MEPIEDQLNAFLEVSEKTKGKNFSRNRPRMDRMEADFYQTPYCLTQTLLDDIRDYLKVRKIAEICDYCSGSGAIVEVLHKNGFCVKYGDIRDTIKTDFFNISSGDKYGIMNPPFRLFNKWAEHCFRVFDVGFALLGPTTYLQGVGRYNREGTGIFQNREYPLDMVCTFNRYPLLSTQLRQDGLIETGMQALSWFVWRKMKPGDFHCIETAHRWLDIDAYVLRKGKRVKA
jgi:hypothetical protein